MSKKNWTLSSATKDYRKSRRKNKGRKCTSCQFGSQSACCHVKSTVAINNGEIKALFCKYFTEKKEL